jgi:transcriptional regulator with XRE-family HTH domain
MDVRWLKEGRVTAGLSQVEAAARLGVSQPYLSQLECGRRAVTPRVAKAAARLYGLSPTALPTPAEPKVASNRDLPRQLAALNYPGYSHVRRGRRANPAAVVFSAAASDNLDARAAEALPWVLQRYPNLDWNWLTTQAKLRNVQNRLGFLATVARQVAEKRGDRSAAEKLRRFEGKLEPSRLAAETTLGREAMPEAEKTWLRQHRSAEARHWNVLSGMRAEDLPYAS